MSLEDFITKMKHKEYYYVDSLEFIKHKYLEVKQNGKLIGESDGQFTGGYSSEIYKYGIKKYSFGFTPNGELDSLVIQPI